MKTIITGLLLILVLALPRSVHAEGVIQALTSDNSYHETFLDGLTDDYDHDIVLKFDDAHWKPLVRPAKNGIAQREYYHGQENAKNWTQFLMVQIVKNEGRFTPQAIADGMRQSATIERVTATDVIYEAFAGEGEKYTLARVLFSERFIYTIYYTTRNNDQIRERRDLWLRLVKEASIQKKKI